MNQHIKDLREHLKENPISKGQKEVGSVLDYLTTRYLEEYPVTSEGIQEIKKKMDPYFEMLAFDASNMLFKLVYDLCGRYYGSSFEISPCISSKSRMH